MGKSVDTVDNSLNSQLFKAQGTTLGLFAKQPLPRQVKTRLTPPLSPDQACKLYQVALEETVSRLQQTGLPLVLCYAGDRDWFATNFPEVALLAQHGADLGLRLQAATQALFEAGAGPVLLLGSDSPDLPLSLLQRALTQLQQRDAVTIPCQDGGYALIGLQRPLLQLFVDVPWSTERVLAATRECARRADLDYAEIEAWDDLDDLASLRRLVERSPQSLTARHIASELAEFAAT